MSRAFTTACAAAVVLASAGGVAMAHHGWSWTADGEFVLEGTIAEIYLGNPHATLKVASEGVVWHVDLAPPARTAAAGFVEGVAEAGDEVIVTGQRSADPEEYRMKAQRVTIDGIDYDVYPDRIRS